jgi:predicted MFS family arabinose efflux permease
MRQAKKDCKRPQRFPGWSVVWVAFTLAVFAWGIAFYGPSVFLQTLHATRGWPISTISAAITTHFMCSAVLVAFLPQLQRRHGLAPVTAAGSVAVAAGACAWASVDQPWQLFPAAVVSGAGWAATSGAAINAIVAPWFERDRPQAISLAFNGASIGGVIFAPLWVLLIALIGFQWAALAIGLSMIVVMLPLAVRYLNAKPADLGFAPDGQLGAAPTVKPEPTLPRAALLRDRRFMTLSASFALGLFAQIGLLSHLISRLTPEVGAGAAAGMMSLTTICAVLGRTGLGWLIGARDRRTAAAANFLVQAVGVLILTLASSIAALVTGCALFGLGLGNLISLPPLLAQKEFARGDVDTVVALVTAVNQAVFSLAPVILGVLRDVSSGYTLAFAIAMFAQLSAAMLVVRGGARAAGMGGTCKS